MNKFELKWEQNFDLLQEFIAEYGRFPKDAELYEGVRIGRWCSNQKKQALNPDYPIERVEKLKQIGLFDTTREALWNQHYQLLEQFIAQYQRFPKDNEIYCDFNIGNWCVEQKYRAMNKKDYNPYRVEKLRKIGLLDSTVKTLSWDEMYQLLQEYITEHNKFPAAKEQYKEYNIGNWCEQQKFQSKKADYPPERLQKLQEIGIFGTTQEAKWEAHYQLLLDFIAEYGRFPKQKESYRGECIGLWCTTQKQNCKKESYSEEHREKLKHIGLLDAMITRDETWEQNFETLQKFIQAFGRLPKEKEIYEEKKIGIWYLNQKRACKKIDFSPERKRKLEEAEAKAVLIKEKYIQETSSSTTHQDNKRVHDKIWETHYHVLCNFIKEHGRMPKQKESYQGDNIGSWCAHQKKQCKKASYPDWRKELLHEIGLI